MMVPETASVYVISTVALAFSLIVLTIRFLAHVERNRKSDKEQASEMMEFMERMAEKALKDIGTINNHSTERRGRRKAPMVPLDPEMMPPFDTDSEMLDASNVQQYGVPNP